VTGAIQLALAPVFLLTGIAGLLSVMAGRLARIIDRARAFTEGRVPAAAALLVCMVIAVLFVEIMVQARAVHLAMQTVRIALHEGKSSSKSAS